MEKLPDSVWRALEYVETFGLMIRRGAQGNCAKIIFNPLVANYYHFATYTIVIVLNILDLYLKIIEGLKYKNCYYSTCFLCHLVIDSIILFNNQNPTLLHFATSEPRNDIALNCHFSIF